MTLQLTKSQLQALAQELHTCLQYEHIDMVDKLLVCILHRLYKRIVNKLLDHRNKYALKLDDETALAFYIYFNDQIFSPTEFNDVTVKTICNSINKEHA